MVAGIPIRAACRPPAIALLSWHLVRAHECSAQNRGSAGAQGGRGCATRRRAQQGIVGPNRHKLPNSIVEEDWSRSFCYPASYWAVPEKPIRGGNAMPDYTLSYTRHEAAVPFPDIDGRNGPRRRRGGKLSNAPWPGDRPIHIPRSSKDLCLDWASGRPRRQTQSINLDAGVQNHRPRRGEEPGPRSAPGDE